MDLKRRLDPKMLNNLRSFIHKQIISKTCQLVALCKRSEHMNCRLVSFVYKEINKQIRRFWFPNHWTGRYVRRPRFVARRLVTWRYFFLEPFYVPKNHPPTHFFPFDYFTGWVRDVLLTTLKLQEHHRKYYFHFPGNESWNPLIIL